MNPDELQLALSYAELKTSIAFQDFLDYQRAQCEALELAALNVPASAGNMEARNALIMWQQRRIVVRELEDAVERAAAIRNEDTDARPNRTNW